LAIVRLETLKAGASASSREKPLLKRKMPDSLKEPLENLCVKGQKMECLEPLLPVKGQKTTPESGPDADAGV